MYMTPREIQERLIDVSRWECGLTDFQPTHYVIVDEDTHKLTLLVHKFGTYILLCETPRTTKQLRRQVVAAAHREIWFRSHLIFIFRDGVDFIWNYCGRERKGFEFKDLEITPPCYSPMTPEYVNLKVESLFGLTSKD